LVDRQSQLHAGIEKNQPIFSLVIVLGGMNKKKVKLLPHMTD